MSEDTTQELPNDDNQAPTTKPMLEAILAKVNELSITVNELSTTVNELSTKVNELSTKVNEGFSEMRLELRKVNKRLDVMSADHQRIRTDQSILEDRVEDLERKAS
jgi:outer membrane murein-binding lipoprotein Lpp